MNISNRDLVDYGAYVTLAKSFKKVQETDTSAIVSVPLIPSKSTSNTNTAKHMFNPYPWITPRYVMMSHTDSSNSVNLHIKNHIYDSVQECCMDNTNVIESYCRGDPTCVTGWAVLSCMCIIIVVLLIYSESSTRLHGAGV